METSWHESGITDGFNIYNDVLENTLGYLFVFEWLELGRKDCKKILDYGCGPGKVAYTLAEQSGKKVLAVDESAGMLKIAKEKRSHPLIEYKKIVDDNLGFVSEGSMDGAMICLVLLNLTDRSRLQRIINEIYRVLKPGTPCVIMEVNPDAMGIQFATFMNGRDNPYKDGELREAWLRLPNGKTLELCGCHWSRETYREILRVAGFKNIEEKAPTLKDISVAEQERYKDALDDFSISGEAEVAPCLLLRGIK